MYRKVYEVTGYVKDGDIFCLSHKPDHPDGPVFLGDEWDYQPVCSECFEEYIKDRDNRQKKPGSIRLCIEDCFIDVNVLEDVS